MTDRFHFIRSDRRRSHARIVGMNAVGQVRSEPQIDVDVMRTMASRVDSSAFYFTSYDSTVILRISGRYRTRVKFSEGE